MDAEIDRSTLDYEAYFHYDGTDDDQSDVNQYFLEFWRNLTNLTCDDHDVESIAERQNVTWIVYWLNVSCNLAAINIGNKKETPWPSGFCSHHLFLFSFLTLTSIVTVGGNVLVIVAVRKEERLRSVTNYLIVSLAVADLVVGLFVMPLATVLEVCNNYWPFGRDVCDLFHSLDVLGSTASIWNLCAISLDRYIAITDPILYPARMTPKKCGVIVAIVWLTSGAIAFPAIAWWRHVDAGEAASPECVFTDDLGYRCFSSLVSFYIPLFIMLLVYYKIYTAARRQVQSLKAGVRVLAAGRIGASASPLPPLEMRIHKGGGQKLPAAAHAMSRIAQQERSTRFVEDSNHFHEEINVNSKTRGLFKNKVANHLRHLPLSKKLTQFAEEQKAAKTLGIVVGVFVLCWLPFFVTNVLYGFCPTCVTQAEMTLTIFTWFGYVNSSMNPVIYAASSKLFRTAFRNILARPFRALKRCCCWCPEDDPLETRTRSRRKRERNVAFQKRTGNLRGHSESRDVLESHARHALP